MEELLRDVVLIFLVAGGVLHVFHRLRLPAVVGLLTAGVIIGPHGIGILREGTEIDRLAELGILLLMFSIALDFTPDRLRELALAFGMGVVQMLICIVVTAPFAAAFVGRWAEAVFLGMVVAHTSSTLMLKLFLDRGEVHTPQLRLGLGISISQDLSIVPMLLTVPLLAGQDGGAADFGLALLKVAGVLAVALALARWVTPFWLDRVVRSRSRELFLIFLTIVCLGTAWATLAVGLSGALGAFLAGLAIAGSRYSHQTVAEVVPFRDLMVSLFFISIGMLLDVSVLAAYAVPAALIVLGVLVLKFFSGFLPVLAWGYPLRIATLVGLAMAQIGEFGFVLSHAGYAAGVISGERFQLFVLVAVLTMLANPFLVGAGGPVYRALVRLAWLRRLEERGPGEPPVGPPVPEGHVVVAGYGLNGRTVVRALRSLGVPHVALDLDPETVREAQRRGEAVHFGDCTRAEVLRRAGLETARVYVVAISDRRATRQTIQVADHVNPGLHIVARTKYLTEIEVLRRLGANEVVAEEFETSLEILARVLHTFGVPRLKIEEIIRHFRGDTYEAFRGPAAPPDREVLRELLPALQIEVATVPPGSPGAGKSLRELDLRARTGATLLAVQRDGRMETVPPPDFRIQENDTVILAGAPRQILDAVRLLEPERPAPAPPPEILPEPPIGPAGRDDTAAP
ncbi:MAG TPA: cation:proton antiporter [Gemmataceae bacterium]